MATDGIKGLRAVEAAVGRAAADAGRDAASVALIAVSKTVPADRIRPLLQAGHRRFGENYVQESHSKWPGLRADHPDCELHLIGPLQSNKTREAVALFDAIHVVDRLSLATALAREIDRSGRQPRLLCQVNTGEEPQKGGVPPGEADRFIETCRTSLGLRFAGLMCIPPFGQPPSPHFALLSRIAARNGLDDLSMGMSDDFPAAIQLGATHVRVGTAIFGARASR